MPLTAADVGSRIAAKREERGLSGAKLAAFADIEQAYLSKIERGVAKQPGYFVLSRIAVALGCDGIDQLVGEPVITRDELAAELVAELVVTPASRSAASRAHRAIRAASARPSPKETPAAK